MIEVFGQEITIGHYILKLIASLSVCGWIGTAVGKFWPLRYPMSIAVIITVVFCLLWNVVVWFVL